MKNALENAQKILKEKKMENLFFIKKVDQYTLPIMDHQVTIYFEAREKYNVLENQILQFLNASEGAVMEIQQLEELIGISEDELASLLRTLEIDETIQIVEQEVKLTKQGVQSVLDGFSPLRNLQQQFSFYYEPVTSYLVEDVLLLNNELEPLHPVVQAENYSRKYCSLLNEENLLAFYKKVTKRSLLEGRKDYKLQSLVHNIGDEDKSMKIQGIELYSKENNQSVTSIWNANNNQLIRLA